MDRIRLGDIATLINGDRGKNYPSQADITDEGDIPFVNAGHLNGRSIDFEEMNYISQDKFNRLNSGKFIKGDVLYCLRGSLGKKAIVNDDVEGAIASSLVIIRPDYNRIDGDYLMFSLDSPSIKEQLIKANNGSSQPNLSAASVREYQIELPNMKVQKDVVNKLAKVRSIIDSRQHEIDLLDELIKARFVELFGDPVTNDKHWDMDTLLGVLEVGRTVTYGIVQTGDDVDEGIPVFRPIDIAGGHVPKREELKKTLPEISDKYKRTLLKGNELLITVRGSVGETFQVNEEFEGCNVGRNIVPLVTDKKRVNQRFLQELFAQKPIKDWLKAITKGIALQGLNMSEFKEMPVIIPDMGLQEEYVEFVEQVDKSKVV